jgi:guanylate kinase
MKKCSNKGFLTMLNQDQKEKGRLFVISAPSGAGKTSVSQAVLEACAAQHVEIEKVVTYTSRAPRSGEVDGVDYHFINREEFLRRKASGFFLETTEYTGNWYGSPASILEGMVNGKSYLMVTDRPGALVIKGLIPSAFLIWLYVDDIKTLRSRLEKRGTDSPDVIRKRLNLAEQEIAQENSEKIFDAHIKNDDFDAAVAAVKIVILST